MKRAVLIIPIAFAALAISTALAAPKSANVVIRHQLHGCHAWSFNGNAYQAAQAGTIARGGTITVIDNDVMPHKLFEKSGPAIHYTGNPALNHMGASVKITFSKPGVYLFGTKPGEDYVKGVNTIGADNVLTLKITVT